MIRDRKCLLSQQERKHNRELCEESPLFFFSLFLLRSCEVRAGVGAAEKHVLVLIFPSSASLLSSKRINHERVASRKDEDLSPRQLPSSVGSFQVFSHTVPERLYKRKKK